MLKFISGNILDSKTETIAQGIACSKTENMATGVARQIDKKFPEAFKQFKSWREYNEFVPGNVWYEPSSKSQRCKPRQIYLATQKNLQKAEYEYLEKSLENLKKLIQKEKIKSVSLPKIGCGHGKLNWVRVKSLIQKYLSELDCEVFVYEEYFKYKKFLKE